MVQSAAALPLPLRANLMTSRDAIAPFRKFNSKKLFCFFGCKLFRLFLFLRQFSFKLKFLSFFGHIDRNSEAKLKPSSVVVVVVVVIVVVVVVIGQTVNRAVLSDNYSREVTIKREIMSSGVTSVAQVTDLLLQQLGY